MDALPKLNPCVCDVRKPKDGLCIACGGAIQSANDLILSSVGCPEHLALITSKMGVSEPAARRD